jgi:hypothetical protein
MRIKWTYPQEVSYPSRFKKFLWEYPNHKAPLEKLIYRILTYGKYDDLRWLYKEYPNEAFALSKKYVEIKRGVKFWMEYWNGQRI